MKELFKAHRFREKSLELLAHVVEVLGEYEKQGLILTVRQVYYQMVSRDVIPNNPRSYMKLQQLVGRARLAGLIDWDIIEDRGRNPNANAHWDSPSQIIDAAAHGYRIDKWENQSNYVEVWVEKDALSGVLWPVCSETDVTFMANKGYSSLSAMYRGSKRLLQAVEAGRDVLVLYLGDHDPSGLDMSRDIEERLEMFVRAPVDVKRLALNMSQVEKYKPPPNPAKTTDSRYQVYILEYGEQSWELDALDPTVLQRLVTKHVLRLRDEDAWEEMVGREDKERKSLQKAAEELKKKTRGR